MAGDSHAEPARFRRVQSFIGGLRIENARFVPPPPSEVPRLMADLDRMIRYEPEPESVFELTVLTRAAIAHAQFEAIHPFKDGNGRTGRLLFPLMFLADGGPPIHLATFLKRRQQEYHDALLAAQMKLRWQAWMQLCIDASWPPAAIRSICCASWGASRSQWRTRLRERGTRRDASVWRVADLLSVSLS